MSDQSADCHADAVRRVLVVDDSRAQRMVAAVSLRRQGFDVVEAGSGEEALQILRSAPVDLVLSDWMMPGMDGLELCRQVRALQQESYVYFILLTSKNEKGAVAQGLDVGADDFLTKPVSPDELRARIYAGDRILKMTRELSEKNRLITATLDEMSALYDALDRDLIEARKMQQSLVRER
ncbi:MAG: response regulator, partial [Maritimibacter sp.]|nr:response regulator [Maritimibacter sp.]